MGHARAIGLIMTRGKSLVTEVKQYDLIEISPKTKVFIANVYEVSVQ